MQPTTYIFTRSCTRCGKYGMYHHRVTRNATFRGERVLERRTDIKRDYVDQHDRMCLDLGIPVGSPVVLYPDGSYEALEGISNEL